MSDVSGGGVVGRAEPLQRLGEVVAAVGQRAFVGGARER